MPEQSSSASALCAPPSVLFLPFYLCAEGADYSLPANPPQQAGPGGRSLLLVPKELPMRPIPPPVPNFSCSACLGKGYGLLAALGALAIDQ